MDYDYFDCRLIFYGVDDFFKNKDRIKACYYEKSLKERYFYKLWLYSQLFISEQWRNNIWDWLHDDMPLTELSREYRLYKNKKHYD